MSAVSRNRERALGLPDPLIEAALVLDGRSTHWSVELAPAQAREFVRRASAYNEFTSDDLVRLIDRVGDAIPPMDYGPGNQNTGHPHHKFRIGNEGSRVVCLKVVKSYLPADYDFDALAKKLELIGKACKADETDVTESGGLGFEFRFWWD